MIFILLNVAASKFQVIRKVENSIYYLAEKPKTLFLLDGFGAFLTAILLFAVLRNLNEYFGMPIHILTYLSVTAACLGIYSIACFLFLKENWMPFIKAISIFNLFYCILTSILVVVYFPMLTRICIMYFVGEIILVLVLAYIELNVATQINKKQIEQKLKD